MKKEYLEITDPIHDFIRLNKTEQQIIDTSVFQRLRRIKQLSGAHLTYPGAQHTRFEHSLGVMHIASMAGIALQSKGITTKDDISNLRLAALLHDIGHGPFSHLFEEVLQRKNKRSHEQIGKQIILKTEIGDILSKNGFDKKLIHNLAVGEGKLQFMNEIVSGALSADMMDYLLRDGYFTGAEHAKIDHNRITYSLDVYKKKLALDRSALVNFETMMISRFQMFKAVYFHKTVRAGEVMLLEAMTLADDELGLTSLTLNDYVKQTDESIMALLLSVPETTRELKAAKKIAMDYQNRRLFKCVFESTLSSNLSQKVMQELKYRIVRKSKVDVSQVFLDTSTTNSIPLTPSKKESKSIILVKNDSKKTISEQIPISKIPLVSSMSGKMNILRVYTQQSNRKKVEITAKSILGELK
tara:strand:+ start:1484 stop:2722 length:1239 start_codon:yes stop_codon:yes gene_type:complete